MSATFKRSDVKELLIPMVENYYQTINNEEIDLYRNTLDCFSAVFQSVVSGIDLQEWLLLESQRQTQKTMQNAIGKFHQKLIGTIDGVEDLGEGNGVDIRCEDKKIIAEVKNKHNTTKGDNRSDLYEKLEAELKSERNKGFTAYYVEVLSIKGKRFEKEFTATKNVPLSKSEQSDENNKNKRKKIKLGPNPKIRAIDVRSFYELLGISDKAIKDVYYLMPELISEILRESFEVDRDSQSIKEDELFKIFFNKAYPEETFSNA